MLGLWRIILPRTAVLARLAYHHLNPWFQWKRTLTDASVYKLHELWILGLGFRSIRSSTGLDNWPLSLSRHLVHMADLSKLFTMSSQLSVYGSMQVMDVRFNSTWLTCLYLICTSHCSEAHTWMSTALAVGLTGQIAEYEEGHTRQL